MTLPQLIDEIKKGNPKAQDLFFTRYSNRMFILCMRYVKNTEDAEERMLDGFYKFFNSIHRFRYQGEAALYTWLKRVMINECIMQLRKKNSFSMVSEAAANDISLDEDVLEKLSATEIYKQVTRLPIGYRTVFNLSVLEGYDHKEIATLLRINEGTSRSQLWKAKSLLQKLLTQNEIQHAKQHSK